MWDHRRSERCWRLWPSTAGLPVDVETLVDRVWGDNPPLWSWKAPEAMQVSVP
jgi:hypothetical protein